MNTVISSLTDVECSSVQVNILLQQSWINDFIIERRIIVPIDDKNHLTKLQVSLGPATLTLTADIAEKEGSSIELMAHPEWNAELQQLSIQDLKIQTKSKNILIKSAGWFTQHFLGSKLDNKIEEKANEIFRTQLEKIKGSPVVFPIPNGGNAEVNVKNITIHEIKFIPQSILATVTIEGIWNLNLVST